MEDEMDQQVTQDQMKEGTEGERAQEQRLGSPLSPVLQQIERAIAPVLAEMGFDLVRLTLSGQPLILQVMAERQTDGRMTVEDCAQISRAIAPVLDIEDPIADPYRLEVSSPGIDRPLTRKSDLLRFAGFEAKLELAHAQDGQRKFTGRIMAVEGDQLRLRFINEEEVLLPIAEITTAKLRLTDDLIAASEKGFKGLN